MRTILLFITTVLCSSCIAMSPGSTTPRNAEPGEVAFELAGPGGAAMVVPVRVNGQGPYPFILDTGATLTCLDSRLADELKLEEVSGVSAVGGTVTGMGAVKLVSIDSLEVGESRASDLRACVLDLEVMGKAGLDAQGLLGLNFMQGYRVTLDFDANIVRFDDPNATRANETQ